MDEYIARRYYSRAKNLMFPLVGIKETEAFEPACYLWWSGEESIENYELICKYYVPADREETFQEFERKVITENGKLKACYQVPDGMVYIFDLRQWAGDVANLLVGKYSHFSQEAQRVIGRYHNDANIRAKAALPLKEKPIHHLNMMFHPQLYYELVGRELGYTVEEMQEIGELYDPVRRDKETLIVDIERDCKCVDIIQLTY